MPFARPTPQQIRDRVSAEIVRASGGAVAILRRSLEWVLARMVAVASHELHGHLSWISRQVLVDQADDAELERHAGIWGVVRTPASRAAGRVTFQGVAGTVIPLGTELRRSDDTRYFVDVATAIGSDGTASPTVTAASPGSAGNGPAGLALQLVTPIAGIRSPAFANAMANGFDQEDDASLRSRILARIQEPPHGGAMHDYVGWVREVIGNAPVWVYPNRLGLGTVVIAFILPDGSIPSPETVADVQAHVDAERPVTAEPTVIAPAVDHLAVRIRLSPDSASVRAAVAAELGAMIIREAEPGGILPYSRLSAAISAAAGEYSHSLIAPATDVQAAFGRIVRLGSMEWVA